GGRGIRDVSSDCGAIADLNRTNLRGTLRQKRKPSGNHARRFDFSHCCKSTDCQRTIRIFTNAAERLDSFQVDDVSRDQSLLFDRNDQVRTAREEISAGTTMDVDFACFLYRGWLEDLKGLWALHAEGKYIIRLDELLRRSAGMDRGLSM